MIGTTVSRYKIVAKLGGGGMGVVYDAAKRLNVVNQIVVDPLLDSVRKDSRWLPLLRGIGKAPEQLAAIRFEVQLPK